MSITEKVNDYLIKKMAKSKCNYLFAIPKKIMFDRIHELSEHVEYLQAENDCLSTKAEILQTKNNTFKTQIEGDTDIKYRLAYERLVEKYESLTSENKSIKDTINVVNDVVKNVSKQNEVLKERIKRTETENNRLVMENKKYKDKEKIIEIKKEAVKHNFTKKVNNNQRVLSK